MSLSDFINRINEEEVIELNDILEQGSPNELIKSNIDYILKENNFKLNFNCEITEEAQNAIMGYYTLKNEDEEFKGVFIANGYKLEDGNFDLISLNLGDKDLKYWGM